jgi:cytochrome b
MTAWFNYTAVFQIIVAGLLIGAGLPALFAIGVRMNAEGSGVVAHDGTVAHRNPALAALSWAIFALVLAVVIIGVLFIARDFIGHHTGWYILGAKHK